jgi:hypothetical protein
MKKITFQLSDREFILLEEYCEKTERNKTDVLRELVRSINPDRAFIPTSNGVPLEHGASRTES